MPFNRDRYWSDPDAAAEAQRRFEEADRHYRGGGIDDSPERSDDSPFRAHREPTPPWAADDQATRLIEAADYEPQWDD